MLYRPCLRIDQDVLAVAGGFGVHLGADVALDAFALLLGVGADYDGARGMLAGQGMDSAQQLVGVTTMVCEDHQRQHAIARGGAPAGSGDARVGLAPQIIQLALDAIQPHRIHLCTRVKWFVWSIYRRIAHSRLQVRPSRSINASASFGPQVPGSYSWIMETGNLVHARSMASTSRQEYSVSSMRVKSVESPKMHSKRSLS